MTTLDVSTARTPAEEFVDTHRLSHQELMDALGETSSGPYRPSLGDLAEARSFAELTGRAQQMLLSPDPSRSWSRMLNVNVAAIRSATGDALPRFLEHVPPRDLQACVAELERRFGREAETAAEIRDSAQARLHELGPKMEKLQQQVLGSGSWPWERPFIALGTVWLERERLAFARDRAGATVALLGAWQSELAAKRDAMAGLAGRVESAVQTLTDTERGTLQRLEQHLHRTPLGETFYHGELAALLSARANQQDLDPLFDDADEDLVHALQTRARRDAKVILDQVDFETILRLQATLDDAGDTSARLLLMDIVVNNKGAGGGAINLADGAGTRLLLQLTPDGDPLVQVPAGGEATMRSLPDPAGSQDRVVVLELVERLPDGSVTVIEEALGMLQEAGKVEALLPQLIPVGMRSGAHATASDESPEFPTSNGRADLIVNEVN